jgi:hypothetical protein
MKTKLATLVSIVALSASAFAADWQADYARLLKKYVAPGGVKYAEWKASAADVKALQGVVDGIAAAPASTAKSKEQLAFHINAYNAWILQEAVAKYPTKSVKDLAFTFFLTNRITVAGTKISFNKLEKDIIRPRFAEPRIHFALNCASRSCPALRNEPYEASKLDTQLDEQTRLYVNSPLGVKPEGDGAALSKIFDWYKEDFGGDGAVLAFLKKYRGGKLDFKKISYQEYDWGLNEAK